MIRKDKEIFELLCRQGELSVQQLSQNLQVSPSSIRRYLRNLDDHPYILRTHGGAVLSQGVCYDSLPVSFPEVDKAEARAIAYLATQIIKPGDVVGLSGGRLCTELALNLRFREGITVVTNAINIACELVGLPGIKVMVCGGIIDYGSYELTGQMISRALEGIYIQKYFVGTDGITIENGLTNRSEAEATAAREFVRHTGQVIVLADHLKFVKSNLAQVVRAEDINTIITSSNTPPEILQPFSEIGTEILIAPVDSQEEQKRKTKLPSPPQTDLLQNIAGA